MRVKREENAILKIVYQAHEGELATGCVRASITIFIKVVFSLDSYLLSLAWLHFASPWERPLCFLLFFFPTLPILLSLQKQAEMPR